MLPEGKLLISVGEWDIGQMVPNPTDPVGLFGGLVCEFSDFIGEDWILRVFHKETTGLGLSGVLPWEIETPNTVHDVVSLCDERSHTITE